mmetsp:Transcript_26231/g.36530  ORF Transcript_26231/g.36530 Transcript_26231/m.36530 type:complete len:103 (-) Transcript_26231:654-962(-)
MKEQNKLTGRSDRDHRKRGFHGGNTAMHRAAEEAKQYEIHIGCLQAFLEENCSCDICQKSQIVEDWVVISDEEVETPQFEMVPKVPPFEKHDISNNNKKYKQ